MINRVKVRRGDTFGSLPLNGEQDLFSRVSAQNPKEFPKRDDRKDTNI